MSPRELLELGDNHPDLYDAYVEAVLGSETTSLLEPRAAPRNDPAAIAAFFAR